MGTWNTQSSTTEYYEKVEFPLWDYCPVNINTREQKRVEFLNIECHSFSPGVLIDLNFCAGNI